MTGVTFCRVGVTFHRAGECLIMTGVTFCSAGVTFHRAGKPLSIADVTFCWAGECLSIADVTFCWVGKPLSIADVTFCWAGELFCRIGVVFGFEKLGIFFCRLVKNWFRAELEIGKVFLQIAMNENITATSALNQQPIFCFLEELNKIPWD
jgi:hypothetical protein